jgi:hypothetical protein
MAGIHHISALFVHIDSVGLLYTGHPSKAVMTK